MATVVATMVGGAVLNAVALTLSNVIASKFSGSDKERERHDRAVEQTQHTQMDWNHKREQRLDFINKQINDKRKSDYKFTSLDDAMREYSRIFGKELPPMPPEQKLEDFLYIFR